MEDKKFLVRIVESVTEKQIFFGFWMLVVGFFVYLMYRYYEKGNRRNFKDSKKS